MQDHSIYSLHRKTIWVLGANGLAASAIIRRLQFEDCHIITNTREELDLKKHQQVEAWFAQHKPHVVVLAAAKVGGILANDTMPVDFLYDNLMIQNNVIAGAHRHKVEKLLFLGSSCAYPRLAKQPMREDCLLSGPLEPTNEWYGLAKIAGIKMCQAFQKQYGCNFISCMPSNLYGKNDNFHDEHSHVPAAFLRRFHEAKLEDKREVVIWGTGKPKREFLYVDDMADACVFLLEHYHDSAPINIGTGYDISIAEFASLVRDVVGCKASIVYDASKKDGAPRKMLDVSKINALGWSASTNLQRGLDMYYQWFVQNYPAIRK